MPPAFALALAFGICAKAIDLVHALVKNSHDPDALIGKAAPIDIMTVISVIIALHTRFCRDGASNNFVTTDLLETSE